MTKSFVDNTLWPEYLEIQRTLSRYLNEVTDRAIADCIHQDASDADLAEGAPALVADGPLPRG